MKPLFGGTVKPIATDWKWKYSDYPTQKNGLKVFSCFSCGGGSTMGYKLAGCDVIGNLEIDPIVNNVYKLNHNPKYNFNMDIREFNNIPNDQLPNELLNLDILDGSPPCTTFSISGDRENSWGKVKKFREGQAEQTLDDLLFVFVETVGKLRPKVAIMENVEGLVVGNAITYLRQVYSKFEQIGYSVRCYLCKGEEMGIPQKRHRVFFIAVKDKFDFDELNMNFSYEPIPFGDVKSDIIDPRVSETTKHLLDNAIEDVDSSLADVNMRLYNKRSRFNEQIIWDDKVCNTLHNHGLYRGNDKCKLQLLDYIHCQTFPEDYNADGTNLVYLIGMSVPPIMIKRIVERILDTNIFNK